VDRTDAVEQGVNGGRCSRHSRVLTSVVPVICDNCATEVGRRKCLTKS
jgi:hypothetical protein